MSFLENKIPPPLVMVAFMLLIWLIDSSGTQMLELQISVALVVVVALVLVRSSIMSFIKQKTTVNPLNPEAATSLVSDGVFKLTRNPMYLAMALVVLAWGLYFVEVYSPVFLVAFVLFMTQFQIVPEERALDKVFGESYTQYKQKVRRWI